MATKAAAALPAASFVPEPIFYKTKMCKFYERGACLRGSNCAFAHSSKELVPSPDFKRTKMCPALLRSGMCGELDQCKFAHCLEQLRPRVAEREAGEVLPEAAPMSGSGPGSNAELAKVWFLQEKLVQMASQVTMLQAKLANSQTEDEELEVEKLMQKPVYLEPAKAQGHVFGDRWSRQSTAESVEGLDAPVPWSRQTSIDLDSESDLSEDEVFGLDEPSETAIEPKDVFAPAESLTSNTGLIVKNTFLDVEEGGGTPPSVRKVKSSPNLLFSENAAAAQDALLSMCPLNLSDESEGFTVQKTFSDVPGSCAPGWKDTNEWSDFVLVPELCVKNTFVDVMEVSETQQLRRVLSAPTIPSWETSQQ